MDLPCAICTMNTCDLVFSCALQVRGVLRRLYCGKSSYVTKCRQCNVESARSSEVSDFVELDLQVFSILRQSYVWTCSRREFELIPEFTSEEFVDHRTCLQVKGVKSLKRSLQALVAADVLDGNNQYSCEVCCTKTDAERMFCVRSLPPCLRINLQRFVFDWNTLQKQKVCFVNRCEV